MNEAAEFLYRFVANCKTGDLLLLGVDLKKDPEVITLAYDDKNGITAAFNLNLLTRMNSELGADFNIDSFKHYTYYEPESGEVLSFLISQEDQRVYFSNLNREINFKKHELIHTEISKKYSLRELEKLGASQGLELVSHFTDSKNYFTNTLFKI